MAVFIISYDLNRPGQNYPDLYDKIKSLGSWAHILDSTWLIDTNKTAKEVFDSISPCLDSTDKIIVIEAKNHWHAILTEEIYTWLRTHLK